MTAVSKKIQGIGESQSIKMSAIVEGLRAEGREVISLNVGETHFETPLQIKEATSKALFDNKTHYSAVPGILELREEMAQSYNEKNNCHISSKNVLLGVGSKNILYSLFQILLNPGDEVLIPSPYWVTIPESVKLASGVPLFFETQEGKIDIDFLEGQISKKTKVLFLNFPNNPTGALISHEEQKKIIDLAHKHDLWVISDEAYESILFDQNTFKSLASFEDLSTSSRFISVQSFSKTFCMTGFRMGTCIASREVIDALNKLQGHLTGNICTFIQYGAIAAIKLPPSYTQNLVLELQANRDLAYQHCSDIFPRTISPGGAFYLFPNVEEMLQKHHFNSASDLSMYILKESGVAVLPGEFFGVENHLRISFAGNREDIEKGLKKIKELLK